MFSKGDKERIIENLKHNEMLDPLGQAWQNGCTSAAKTPGRATVNKLRLCGSLFLAILININAGYCVGIWPVWILRPATRMSSNSKSWAKYLSYDNTA